jgi:carbonic anhydrase/acetyltransferase-like protein (isoleucine patch superfamily)
MLAGADTAEPASEAPPSMQDADAGILAGLITAGGLEAAITAGYSSYFQAVVLDPPTRLMNSRVLGEWNGTGLDGWSVSNAASSSVAGGVLTVTSQSNTSNPVRIDLTALSAGPDLNFGYFDYLQLRMQLPAGCDKDVTFSFGTSTRTGFASDRVFSIPAADLAKDGLWHTYRLDLGLVVWWRDTLRDLRIQPLGTTGAGETVAIDYVEVGDLPGDVLLVNTNLNYAPGVTAATAQKLESKHFVIWWDPAVNPDGTAFNTATHGLRALRMLEESYQVYYKVLGFDEPFQHSNPSQRNGNRYKVNHLTWHSGYWMSSLGGFSYLNVGTSGLADENWGNPVPHEYGHVVDGQQQGYLVGGHWESHANFYREQRTNWFAPQFAAGQQSTIEDRSLVWSNYRQDHGRLIYADFRIHLALQEYATLLGLPADTATRLWTTGSRDQTVYNKLATLLPAGTSMKDVIGTILRYWPMLDFSTKALLRARLWPNADTRADFEYRAGSPLIPLPDNSGWYRVPLDRAPEKFAYMFHDLTPSAGTVTVELRGLDILGTTEDWRWCLAAIDAQDNVRYSPVWAPGTQSFTLGPGETKVQLIVVATPGSNSLDLDSYFNTKPTDKHLDRLRYPYEVRLVGATPASERLNWNTTSGRTHSNGGGWVANTASVASTVYVGPNARVLGSAVLTGNARIEDYAVVAGSARVRDNARVSGYAVVYGNAIVENNARVREHAMVANNARVQGNAVVEGFARLIDSTIVRDGAIVRGNAYPFGSSVISGTAIAEYDYSMAFSLTDGVQANHVPWGDWFEAYFADTQVKPRGLVASYRVEETSGELLWDEFGSLHAFARGSPGRVEDGTFNSRVLELNGTSQYVLLDRSAVNLTDATIALWCRPATAAAGGTLLYLGGSANTYLKLVARDANGLPRLTLSLNGQVQELAGTQALPAAQWTHLAITFDGSTVRLYVNGTLAGSLASSRRPADFLAPGDWLTAEPLYLGRDATGDYFAGRLEDMRFCNVVLTAAEVAAEKERAGVKSGRFFTAAPQVFDGATTMFESGVRNGTARTLAAWIKPYSSDDVSYYEPIFDSNDERTSGRYGTGLGLDNGTFKVRLDGLGFWSTGVAATLNTWQHVAVAFDGSTARLYVNGTQRASRTYSAGSSQAGKNYRLGWGQSGSDVSTRAFFHGEIFAAEVYDRMVVPVASLGNPVAGNDLVTVPAYSGATTVNVLANDSHPSPLNPTLTVTSVTQPANGTVTRLPDGSAVTYTPANKFAGTDSFTYTISDGFGGTATATVQVVVNPAPMTIAGSAGNDVYYARISIVGGVPTLETWAAGSPSGGPAYSWPLSTLASCTFDTGSGNDTVTLDVSNGVSSGLLRFWGGAGTDTLVLTGTTADHTLNVQASGVTVGAATLVTMTGLEGIRLDGSSVISVGTLIVGTPVSLPARGGVLRVSVLSIAGSGRLDLADNDMIIDYGTGGSPAAAVRTWLAYGRLGLTPSLVTTTASPSPPHATALGYVDNTLVQIPSFAGQALAAPFGQVLIKHTYAGDTNLDGQVTAADMVNIVANLGRSGAQWFTGDLNHDGAVTLDDLAEVQAGLGAGAVTGPLLAAPAKAATPSKAAPPAKAAALLKRPSPPRKLRPRR